MNKPSYLFLALIGLASAFMTGCDNARNEATMVPFLAEEDGKWGLISTDGKVLLENEFRNAPTLVTDDRFFVQNQDGFWEMYSAGEKPERIGGELRYASTFSNGVAMVTPRDQAITIIDKKGETVAELVEFEGKKVSWADPFKDGLAVVSCDTLQGVVDTKGQTVVKPEFSNINLLQNGLMVVDSYAYASTHNPYDTLKTKGTQVILDSKGAEKFSLDAKKYWDIVGAGVTDKYVTVRERKLKMKTEGTGADAYTYPEVTWKYSVVDYEGKVVIAPSESVKAIIAIRDEMYAYQSEDDLYGVKTFEGKDVVPADYQGVNFIGSGFISVMKHGNEDNGYAPIVTLFDNEGQRVGNASLRAVAGNIAYLPLAGSNVFVEVEDGEWTILDAKGQKLEDLPKIYSLLPYSSGDSRLFTDKVNYEKFISGLKITPNSVGNFTFEMGPRQAIETQQKMWNTGATGETMSKPKASDYSWMKDIYFWKEVDGLNYSGEVNFPKPLSKQTYSQRKVIDYTYGNYYWYHMEKVPTGYVFNDIKPSTFQLDFAQYNFYGKLRPLYKALVKYCKKWGTVEDSNSGATLMQLNNGKQLLIALKDDKVIMKWGNLGSDDKWIGQYSGNAEKLQSTYEGNQYVKDAFGSDDTEDYGDV